MAKNIYSIGFIFVITVLMVALLQGLGGDDVLLTNAQAEEKVRVLLTPNSLDSRAELRGLVDVRHDFGTQFSADVPAKALAKVKKLASVEEVAQYEILAKPVCGDGVVHPKEKCGEPGLLQCPIGTSCQGCQCVDNSAGEDRACFPNAQSPYGVTMVNGGTGGAGVTVAVLDTGVQKDHPDLNVALCKDATKRGIKNGCSDGNGHGTHTAGTVAANGGDDGQGIYGVAPDATLWSIKVCGNGGWCFSDDMAAAITYAADKGANVISMSIGGDTQSSLTKDAIAYAVSKGVLVVAAAGNDGPADGSIDYPGANVQVVAVAAIDVNENVASWSSRGLNDGDYVIEALEVEVGAPGVNVESTWTDGCFRSMSGTSMATPHVAGLAAKLWQGDAASTRTYLQNLAKLHDLHTLGDDTASGFGLPVAP